MSWLLAGQALTLIGGYGAAALGWLLVGAAAAYYFVRAPEQRVRPLRMLLVIGALGRIALAAYVSVAQYYAWSSNEIGALFLPPHQPWSYFIGYVGLRVWLPVALALVLAGLWYGFARLINRKSERYFEQGDIEVTTLAILALGWPLAFVLVPLAGVVLIVLSLVRMILFKQSLTTLGVPFLVAAVVTLALRGWLNVWLAP